MGNNHSFSAEELEELQKGTKFTQEQIMKLHKRFRKLDKNGDGEISWDEFESIPHLQQNPLLGRYARRAHTLRATHSHTHTKTQSADNLRHQQRPLRQLQRVCESARHLLQRLLQGGQAGLHLQDVRHRRRQQDQQQGPVPDAAGTPFTRTHTNTDTNTHRSWWVRT